VTLVLGLTSEDVNNKADESNSRGSDTAVLEPNEQEVIQRFVYSFQNIHVTFEESQMNFYKQPITLSLQINQLRLESARLDGSRAFTSAALLLKATRGDSTKTLLKIEEPFEGLVTPKGCELQGDTLDVDIDKEAWDVLRETAQCLKFHFLREQMQQIRPKRKLAGPKSSKRERFLRVKEWF
jgi:hypothetical protein